MDYKILEKEIKEKYDDIEFVDNFVSLTGHVLIKLNKECWKKPLYTFYDAKKGRCLCHLVENATRVSSDGIAIIKGNQFKRGLEDYDCAFLDVNTDCDFGIVDQKEFDAFNLAVTENDNKAVEKILRKTIVKFGHTMPEYPAELLVKTSFSDYKYKTLYEIGCKVLISNAKDNKDFKRAKHIINETKKIIKKECKADYFYVKEKFNASSKRKSKQAGLIRNM